MVYSRMLITENTDDFKYSEDNNEVMRYYINAPYDTDGKYHPCPLVRQLYYFMNTDDQDYVHDSDNTVRWIDGNSGFDKLSSILHREEEEVQELMSFEVYRDIT